jgi:hypothetical protein
LSKFVKLLGRTKVKYKCPDLNASHELLTQVCEGHVLAALIQRTGMEGFEELRGKISSGAWREAVESIANDWLQLDFVDRMREDAGCEAARATTGGVCAGTYVAERYAEEGSGNPQEAGKYIHCQCRFLSRHIGAPF